VEARHLLLFGHQFKVIQFVLVRATPLLFESFNTIAFYVRMRIVSALDSAMGAIL